MSLLTIPASRPSVCLLFDEPSWPKTNARKDGDDEDVDTKGLKSSHTTWMTIALRRSHSSHSRVVSLRVWFSNFQPWRSMLLGRRWLWGGRRLQGNPPMWIQQLWAQRSNKCECFCLVVIIDKSLFLKVTLWMLFNMWLLAQRSN